jgi:hypothetical protein
MRTLLHKRPSPAMLMSLVALFVALGGSAGAVVVITSANIKNGTIRGNDIHNRTITGKKLRNHTVAARQTKVPERYREVGTPGQPAFENGAKNFVPVAAPGVPAPARYSTAAFLKDNEGFVHLKGTLTARNGTVAFTLPPGYRPRRVLDIGTIAGTSKTTAVGFIYVNPNGDVQVGGPAGVGNYGLDSIGFRAGA